ncbi:MAG: hypothetical protein ACFCVH_03245 [Alphaproteobacteria bacterium]
MVAEAVSQADERCTRLTLKDMLAWTHTSDSPVLLLIGEAMGHADRDEGSGHRSSPGKPVLGRACGEEQQKSLLPSIFV